MRQIITKLPTKPLLKHLITPFSTLTKPEPEKLTRIATELLSLNAVELNDYSILFNLKMGLKSSGLASLSSGPGQSAQPGEAVAEKKVEKTVFEIKLESFEAAAKIKIIKEVRSFTDLGLKESKDLVEKYPSVLKVGVSKDEGQAIVEKLKTLGAVAVLQ